MTPVRPLLFDPRWRLPYYTRHTLGRSDPPTRPYLAKQAQVCRALLHQRGPPHLINPRWRLPYGTGEAPANMSQMELFLLH